METNRLGVAVIAEEVDAAINVTLLAAKPGNIIVTLVVFPE